MTIPDKATRLGKYLRFNDTTGNPEAGNTAGLYTAAGMNHYNFTGDGTTVNFTLGMEPGGENNTQVYIDGVYQQKDGYNVSGAVVQFSVAPPNLSTIEVMVIEVLPVGATTASQVSFTQAGSTYGRNVQLKLQESVSVKDFGAVGDGSTDDFAAIQSALDSLTPYDTLEISGGTFITSAPLVLTVNNVTIFGNGVIKAQDSSTSLLIFDAANLTGVTVDGLTLDGNKANRTATQIQQQAIMRFAGSTDCSLLNATIQGSLGFGGFSTVAVDASNGALRFLASNCRILNCGDTPLSLPSDGIFVRGNFCAIENCFASDVTDTGFVLEGCQNSSITNVVGRHCTALAAISNDTSDDLYGNFINGATNLSSFIGSAGGVVGVLCVGAGHLYGTIVSNVTCVLAASSTGIGPVIQARRTGTGRIKGLTINNPTVYTAGSSGVAAQGILVQSCDDVQVNNANIRMDTSVGSTGIRFDGDCGNGIIQGGSVIGADYGVSALNTSEIQVANITLRDQASYSLLVADTATMREDGSRVSGSNAGFNVAASATLIASHWQAWTPVFSTNLGDDATSFTATPTIVIASIKRSVNSITVTMNYTATLNAITPEYVSLTLPSGYAPINALTYNPALVLNDTTYETGYVRSIASPSSLLVYRANGASYSTNAAITGQFSFTFQSVN
tara:strand:+ start:52 stop:2070 length:2019 start_codon:yes stop_codon:yes gene_type:complete